MTESGKIQFFNGGKFMKYISIVLLLMATFSANAQLFDRGNGLIYDDEYDVTWLADANYALTSGYQPVRDPNNTFPPLQGEFTGAMTWDEAVTWIGHLNQVELAGYNDWRLPSAYNSIDNLNGVDPINTLNGGGDVNVNDSELWHLSDLINSNSETNLFQNIKTTMYWSADASTTDLNKAWMTFVSGIPVTGSYYVYDQGKIIGSTYAWAVRTGDIDPVPLPAASWFFAPALAWLFSIVRPVRTRES